MWIYWRKIWRSTISNIEKFDSSQLSRQIVYLLIQPEISNFPFDFLDWNPFSEKSSKMEKEQYFLRIPNLDIISNYLESSRNKHYDMLRNKNKWYYVVNPQGDWKGTEKDFSKFVSEHSKWEGIVSRKPEETEFLTSLKKADMYLYCGHGFGGDFFNPYKMAKKQIKSGCLIFGCRSCCHVFNGKYPMSNSFNYFFIGGAPFVAGCLWNVIDKDIDPYSQEFIKNWIYNWDKIFNSESKNNNSINEDTELTIVKSRHKAMEKCTYPYLTGHSLVFYGIPLILF